MMHDKKEATTEYAKMWLLIKKNVATNINAIHFVSHHLANNSYHSLHFYTRSEVFLRFYAIINLNLPSVLDKSPHSLGWIALVRHLGFFVTHSTLGHSLYFLILHKCRTSWRGQTRVGLLFKIIVLGRGVAWVYDSIVCMLTYLAKCPT